MFLPNFDLSTIENNNTKLVNVNIGNCFVFSLHIVFNNFLWFSQPLSPSLPIPTFLGLTSNTYSRTECDHLRSRHQLYEIETKFLIIGMNVYGWGATAYYMFQVHNIVYFKNVWLWLIKILIRCFSLCSYWLHASWYLNKVV